MTDDVSRRLNEVARYLGRKGVGQTEESRKQLRAYLKEMGLATKLVGQLQDENNRLRRSAESQKQSDVPGIQKSAKKALERYDQADATLRTARVAIANFEAAIRALLK